VTSVAATALTPLIGRDLELKALLSKLEVGGRLVTLVGPGRVLHPRGAGLDKSQLSARRDTVAGAAGPGTLRKGLTACQPSGRLAGGGAR
jgi:hypothetical protein